MMPAHRQNLILERLERQSMVRVADLSREFGVTTETIRRDLEQLSDGGLVSRTHGGAVATEALHHDRPFRDRSTQRLDEKSAIARSVVDDIKPGEILGLDASSTSTVLADLLPDVAITVVTNSAAIIQSLGSRPNVTIIATGGVLDPQTMAFTGTIAEATIKRFTFDRLFISCRGIDPKRGVGEASDELARLKQCMIEAASAVYVLADHTKFDRRPAFQCATWDEVDCLVTDESAPAHAVDAIAKLHKTKVITAKA
jgi:DeoR/GlpR family transcriptional regulator of sugar metabolism